MNQRSDPDELLKQIQTEDSSRGKLKIFLGYAAGVGKTYTMLEAAHQRQQQGVDVVIGYIETHDREDTDALVHGLEILPQRLVEYHGITLKELNTDAVIKRHPELVLIDEFAHTNSPGSRHPKRYLDVKDILDAGINVYTTLNIQHLESMKDVVAQVTGVIVRETVPDGVLDEASEIEVIDLPPDELLSRLKEGKVYVPEQAKRAIEKFFRKGNLSALREMSLRRAAERIDNQMREYMRTRAIQGPWAAAERLLVCISPSPLSEKLVRTTRRLADELKAEWFVVYVKLTSKPELNLENEERIERTMQLAEQLGAHTRTLIGGSIPDTVLTYSKKHNITKIVVGKPIRSRWREILSGSIVDQLIHASGDIDIYIINEQPDVKPAKDLDEWRPHQPFWRYFFAIGLVILATIIGKIIHSSLEPVNLVMIYLVCTVVAAVFLGRGPALLTSFLGVLAYDFFLVPPFFTFAVSDTQYFITFIGLLLVSIVVSSLTARLHEQAEAAIQREAHTFSLFTLGRELTSATDLHQVADIVISHISQVFGRDAVIFLPENGLLKIFATTTEYSPDMDDMAVASWAFEHDQPAGLGTDTLPAASLRCQPLKTARGQIGVIGIHPKEDGKILSPDQRQTFNAFANQAALAVERAILAEQAQQAELLQATEKLQTALLNSISHDLRTPLVSITGALSSLREESLNINPEDRDSLLETAYSEAERLNRLVGNLLNMTRLEANAIYLRLELCDIQDAIGAVLDQLEERIGKKPIVINIPEGLPLVSLDFTLFGQALLNVIDNAVKYSPNDTQIDIEVRQTENEICIQIGDRGIGIPEEDLERVFDKFYRVSRPESVKGTGLGLAICKGIIEIHGGRINASNRPGGGTLITINLPKVNSK
jgi:two-component system sensor histidine kinase KdpD